MIDIKEDTVGRHDFLLTTLQRGYIQDNLWSP